MKKSFCISPSLRYARRALRGLLLGMPALLLAPLASASTAVDDSKAQLAADYAQLPLGFEANHGQFDSVVRYLAQGEGYTLFLTGDEAVLSLRKGSDAQARNSVIRASLVGAQPQPPLQAEQRQAGRSHYFRGQDPSRWVRDVERYARVRYQGVYPGVDLVYYGNQGELEYDFVVAPQADASAICMHYAGVTAAQLGKNGELRLEAAGGDVVLKKPLVYQDIAGARVTVPGRYSVQRRGKGVDVAFNLGDYDRKHALVIDPVLVYSTYLGGSGNDSINGATMSIAVDADGQAYVIGTTQSSNFPIAAGSVQTALVGTTDVFVTKFAADGKTLIYSSYLGGNGLDQGSAVAVNGAGEAYITGTTTSLDFPTKNPLYGLRAGVQDQEIAAKDAFVARLSSDGKSLLYSSYLGGSDDLDQKTFGNDIGYAIALDSAGNIYVAGQTTSVRAIVDEDDGTVQAVRFPTQSAVQPLPGSSTKDSDAFVTKLSADGQTLIYSSFLGGAGIEIAYGIAVDASGQATVAGQTASTDFPTLSAFQPSYGGAVDGFVTALSADGLSRRFSSYLGGTAADMAYAIAVGRTGKIYLTGSTASASGFPLKSALDASLGGTDAFVTVLTADGVLDYSSYLGGAAADFGRGVALDSTGNIYVSGYTSSSDFPSVGAFQTAIAGSSDAFVTELAADGSNVIFSSYLGGSGVEQGFGIAVDSQSQIYVTGFTTSTNFKTEQPFQPNRGGTGTSSDAFVARIGGVVVVAPGTLALSAATYSVDENVDGGKVVISVSRTGGSSGAASVAYATSNGSAVAGSEYVAKTGTLNWADGDAETKTIDVTINDNDKSGADKTFSLSLSGAAGAALGTPATAVVTIVNDDAERNGTLQFEDATYFVNEEAGTLTVGVSRSGGSDGAASVAYATSNGTATAGSDYVAQSGTLNWTDGDSAVKTFTVPITDDALAEGNETFTLKLSGATVAALGDPSTATATIVDNETTQPGVLHFGAASYSVGESGGSLSLTVLREVGSDGAISVMFNSCCGTATAGTDYTAVSGKLEWADGDSSAKTIVIPIIGDSVFEGNETFDLVLSAATGGAVLDAPSSVTVTIVDDDVAFNGSFQLDAGSYQIGEGDGSLSIVVSRVKGSDGAVSVRYATSSGTATSGADFTATSGTLSWAAGDTTSRTVIIPITQDTLPEGRETFGFALTVPTGGAALGSPATATVTIIDDERGLLRLSDSAYSVNEGAGSVTINVLRSGGGAGAVSVDYSTADGSAVSPGDFIAVSGTLNWADGDDAPKLIVVPIIDDNDVEPTPETFSVKLANVSGGAGLGTPDTATVSIVDNEVRAGALQFDAAAYRVAENAGVVRLTVNRVDGTDNAVTVRYATNQGTAISGSDYNAASGTLSWAAGDATPRVLTIQILDDGNFEGDETFSVALSQPTGGAMLGGPAITTITIADDEVAFSGGIRLGASAYEVDEAAGSIAIAVVRGGSSDGVVSVAYSTVNGQAVSGSDYIAGSGRLTWAAGDMEPKTIAVQILRDASIEGPENFSIVLSSPTGGVALDNPSSATVTITDASTGDEGSGGGQGGGGAMDPRWLALLLIAAMTRGVMVRRRG